MAKLNRIIAESRYRLLSNMDPNTIEGSLDSVPGGQGLTALATLRGNLATARATYAQNATTKGPNLPEMKALKASIDEMTRETTEEENRLLTQAKGAFDLAKSNEVETNAALDQQKTDAYKLRDALVDYTIRQREFERTGPCTRASSRNSALPESNPASKPPRSTSSIRLRFPLSRCSSPNPRSS